MFNLQKSMRSRIGRKLDQFSKAHYKQVCKQENAIKVLKASITTDLKLLKTFANYGPL